MTAPHDKLSAHPPSRLPELISSFTSQPHVNSAPVPETASEPTFACRGVCTWVPSHAAIKTQSKCYFQPKQLPGLHSQVGGAQAAWCEMWRKHLGRSKPSSLQDYMDFRLSASVISLHKQTPFLTVTAHWKEPQWHVKSCTGFLKNQCDGGAGLRVSPAQAHKGRKQHVVYGGH